jgi:hypothetical protein
MVFEKWKMDDGKWKMEGNTYLFLGVKELGF